MVKYHYDKYSVNANTYWVEGPWVSTGNAPRITFSGYNSNYVFDKNANVFTIVGPVWASGTTVQVGDTLYLYTAGTSTLVKYEATESKSSQFLINTRTYQKTLSSSTQQTDYSQGSLIQGGIIAENGTYPTNGRHTDGYWYVRGTVANIAPTIPGSFVQPVGELTIGDSKVISWGASTDENNNLSNYILEMALNGTTAWTQIYSGSATNFTYTIPIATKIQFRVKAQDSTNLQSAYQVSSIFNITKPKYYWSKYSTLEERTYSPNLGQSLINYDSIGRTSKLEAAAAFLISKSVNPDVYTDGSLSQLTPTIFYSDMVISSTGSISLQNIQQAKFSTGENLRNHITKDSGYYNYLLSIGHAGFNTFYFKYKSVTYKMTLISRQGQERDSWGEWQYIEIFTGNLYVVNGTTITSTNYSRGSLIQSGIIAAEDAYQNDKRHTDGFWYLRGSLASQSIAPTSSFILPTEETIFKSKDINIEIKFGSSTATSISLYEVDYTFDGEEWKSMEYNNTLTRILPELSQNKEHTILQFRVRVKNTSNIYSDYIYSPVYTIRHFIRPSKLSIKTMKAALYLEDAKSLVDLKPEDYDGLLSLSDIADFLE